MQGTPTKSNHTTFDIAILLLVFNRPETTRHVFEAIKKIKPTKLYLASDGPRPHKKADIKKVEAVKSFLITSVDWDCEVKTLFRGKNMGCGQAVFEAISWFFNQEEMGIILEDDILPLQSFFPFCQELLLKYHKDERIAMISGSNHSGYCPPQSYVFSKYKACWGWASWRRAWKNMDFEMRWLESQCKEKIIQNMGYSTISESYWRGTIDHIKSGRINTWDWQWYFSIAANNQLCIFPKNNLTENIGFHKDATHTLSKPNWAETAAEEITFPLIHPDYVIPDPIHDQAFEERKIKNAALKRFIPIFLKKVIKKALFLNNNLL
jgi:hypothetical protein